MMEYQVAVMPGVYQRYDPRATETPVVVDVSRSGRDYPSAFRSPLSFSELHDNVSMYMDDFYFCAPEYGATLLIASFPHTFIDANRELTDVDPDLIDGDWPVPLRQSGAGTRGLGLIKRTSRYGTPLQEHKLTYDEICARIEGYWEPYHRELNRIVRSKVSTFGVAVQVSCHCMSAVGLPTHPDPGQERADFCIGDMDGTTAAREYTDLLVEVFRSCNYSVSVNEPYTGGILMSRNADPKRNIHSLMIEINKRLFMSIDTFKLTPGALEVRLTVEEAIRKLCDYANAQGSR